MYKPQKILKQSFIYSKNNIKQISVFTGLNFVIISASNAFGGWQHPSLFLFLPLIYLLWVTFFRIYFNIKPMFDFWATIHSLNPSAKIILYMCAFGACWILFTIILGLLGKPIDFLEHYIDKSNTISIVLSVLFTLASPNIIFRPYFAWIGSVINRNYSLRYAYRQTKNNYLNFLTIFVLINMLFLLTTLIPFVWMQILLSSIIFTYFNITLAKSYEFFFKV